jgi:3-hydroxybutyryl-CoA dehydrogenase
MESIVVIGAGTMGTGIAQLAALHGHATQLVDSNGESLYRAEQSLKQILHTLSEKGKITTEERDQSISRLRFSTSITDCDPQTDLIIEAIIEDVAVKRALLNALEQHCGEHTLFATNTSSLSVGGVFGAFSNAERTLGLHFFNPAPLMPLVEVIGSLQTSPDVLTRCCALMKSWNKIPVLAKDLPGFIVNRLARPFYGEALRIYEEGIADPIQIDAALTEQAGFKMGPFTLMDLIGLDVNYAVSCSVFESFYFDPRYRPSVVQKRMVEAGFLGKKSGRGFYQYDDQGKAHDPAQNSLLDQQAASSIVLRVLAMLVNEACEARLLGLASAEDLELAMVKGVNYPRGLLEWGDSIGPATVLAELERLQSRYGDMRYRASAFLRDRVKSAKSLKA